MFDIMAHPDLVKVWGGDAPVPSGDLRRYYEPAIEGFLEGGVAVEVSTAGLRKPVGEIYPSRVASSRRRSAPGCRSRSRATPTRPTSSASATRTRSSCSSRSASSEICVFERRQRRLEPVG